MENRQDTGGISGCALISGELGGWTIQPSTNIPGLSVYPRCKNITDTSRWH